MYRIEWRDGGEITHTASTDVSIESAIVIAEAGMIDHAANFAAIIDMSAGGIEVWSGRNDTVRD